MKHRKLGWYILDKEYVKYLQSYDNRVHNIDYGKEIKPYIGIILQVNDINYYAPISSVKKKFYNMKESRDLILVKDGKKILSAINLNNMIPVQLNNIKSLEYSKIHLYRKFDNPKEKQQYIALLNKEIRIINNKKEEILDKAIKVYNEKKNYPTSKLSKRCCDFTMLEEKCKQYNLDVTKESLLEKAPDVDEQRKYKDDLER